MRREAWFAVSVLTGLVMWACGSDDEGSGPAPSNDAGPTIDGNTGPSDSGTPDAPGANPTTAGKCGATERSLSFGSNVNSGILGGEDEAVAALAADTQNNLFVAGWTRESLDGGTKNKSLLLEKRDATRSVLWRKVAGDDTIGAFAQAFTRVHGMALQSNGGIVVAGLFAGTLNLGGSPLANAKPEIDAGGFDAGPDAGDGGLPVFPPCTFGTNDCSPDIFVARFDPTDGAHTWSVRFGAESGDGARAVAIAPDGSIFAAGSFELAVDFGATKLTSAGKADAFVVHLDADGNVLGAFRLGGTGDDVITGLAVDATSGDVIVSGYYTNAITIGATTHTAKHTNIDGFVAKLSPTGEARWSKSLNSGRGGQIMTAVTDATGGVYVGGSIDGTFEFAGTAGKSVYLEDAFIAKLDGSNGNQVWLKLWGNDGEEATASIALGPNGSIFAGGATDSPRGVDFGGGIIGGGLVPGPFLVELTGAGEHVCSRSYPGARGPESDATVQIVGAGANAVVAATPTTFAAGGSFAATLDLGKGPMTSKGGYDLWLADFQR